MYQPEGSEYESDSNGYPSEYEGPALLKTNRKLFARSIEKPINCKISGDSEDDLDKDFNNSV